MKTTGIANRLSSTKSQGKGRCWLDDKKPLQTYALLSQGFMPTKHIIGHFRDVLPSQSLGVVLKKLNLTQQKQTTHYEGVKKQI